MTLEEQLQAPVEKLIDSSSPPQDASNEMSFEDQLKAPIETLAGTNNILSNPTQITQGFGTYNEIEPTPNHLAGDTNFAANMGEPVKIPSGKWTVTKAYNQASPQGSPGDYSDNAGWGNDVWLKDEDGHTLHFLHLSNVNVQPGQQIGGGTVVGSTGASGNATGSNLGVEYYDPQGNINDFMQSPYASYVSLDK